MTTEDLKKNIYRNSISNYLFLVMRLGLGLIVFRMIYQALTPEEFGFWALLWSVFGYGILLDFGFGFTAQKRVAELSLHQEWTQLSQVLSTIFFSYVGVAAVIILVGLVGSPYLINLFKISGASTISAKEITNLPALVAKLNNPTDPLSQRLHDSLSKSTQNLLSTYSSSSGNPKPLTRALTLELNKLIADAPLYDAKFFAGKTLTQETQNILAQDPKKRDNPRLNRLLLADAYPNEIAAGELSSANKTRFASILRIFFCAMGLAFPLGIFPEILRGQQRISLANYTLMGGYLISFILVCFCIKLAWGLKALLAITLACSMASDLVCGFFALRKMPLVKILPRYFSRGMIRETARFSIFAYITTLTTIILTRTDQLVIGATLAVSAIAVYQAGAKVGEMFTSFALQIPETLSPAAAHLHAKGDKDFLRKLLVDGTRFSVMLATPLYLIIAFYMRDILRVLTGATHINHETFWVGQTLLFWGYTTVLTQSVSKRIFMMCGHERKLMWLGLGEAALNLGLSLGLILYFKNVLCVAVGSLTATFVFGWFYLWPWAAREANMSGWLLARTVLLPTAFACLPLAILIVIERSVPHFQFRESIYALMIECSLAGAVAAYGTWKMALNAQERGKFLAYFSKFFSKENPA